MSILTVKDSLVFRTAICTSSCLVSRSLLFLIRARSIHLDFDQSIKDMKKHNFTSMVISEYQNGVCKEKKLDPEDVLCARLTISGSFTIVKIHNSFSSRIS